MDGSVGVFDIKISSIDAGVVAVRITLDKEQITGILSMRSAAGADRAEAKINAISINFID